MDKNEFANKFNTLKEQVNTYITNDNLKTEEATKNALIMPFFNALGYNVFNPDEFIPEFTADFGSKKGERVDYAIKLNNQIQILVEAKELSNDLSKNDSQLFRYFTATKAKFGILTNGNTYKFYTDLESPNVMDKKPFLTIEVSDLRDSQINELFKFTKENFDVDDITKTASDLKYIGLIKEYLKQQLKNPDEEFAKLIISNIYDGIKTKQVVDSFKPTISRSFNQLINERVNSKLNTALNQTTSNEEEGDLEDTEKLDDAKKNAKIITTPEEIEVYTITKLILSDVIESDRVFYRDNQHYFNILLDNTIRRWIIRVYFKQNRNFIVLHDETQTELEFNTPIDIYNYKDKIIECAKKYIKD